MKRVAIPVIVLAVGIFELFLPDVFAGKDPASRHQATKQESRATKKNEIIVTFVELGSVNCIPCKMMRPVMSEIEKEYAGRVNVVFYDVWTKEGSPYAKQYKIQAIPTQVFLDKHGKEFFRHVGFFPKEEVTKILRQQGVQ